MCCREGGGLLRLVPVAVSEDTDVLPGGGSTLRRTLAGLRSPWQIRLLWTYAMPSAMPRSTPITGSHRCFSFGGRKRPLLIAARKLPPLQYSCTPVATACLDGQGARASQLHTRRQTCLRGLRCHWGY